MAVFGRLANPTNLTLKWNHLLNVLISNTVQMGISCTILNTATTQRKVLVPDSHKLTVSIWYHGDNSLHCWLQSWLFIITKVLRVHRKENSEYRRSPPSLTFLVDALCFRATGSLQTGAEGLLCSWCHLCYFLLFCQQFLSHLFLCPCASSLSGNFFYWDTSDVQLQLSLPLWWLPCSHAFEKLCPPMPSQC